MLTITLLVMARWEAERIRKHSEEEAHSIVSALSHEFAQFQLLGGKHADAAVDLAAKIESFKTIRYLELYDAHGKHLISFKHPEETLKFQTSHRSALNKDRAYFYFDIPYQYQNNNLGSAYFVYSKAEYHERLKSYYRQLTFLIPALLGMSFLIAVILQRATAHPIRILANAVNAIAKKQGLDFKLTHSYGGELGELFDGFNAMMAQLNRAREKLNNEKIRLETTLESIAEGVITTDLEGNIRYINPEACNLLGRREEECRAQPLNQIFVIVSETTHSPLVDQTRQCLNDGMVCVNLTNTLLKTSATQLLAIQSSIAPIHTQSGEITGAVLVFRNVSESREMARRLEHQASHDSLTELLNRVEFEAQLQSLVKNLVDSKQHALLYLDLDQFKIVNDTCGHFAGDTMLKQISALICNRVREADLVARLGGDEFAVLLPSCSTPQAIEIANSIRQLVSEYTFSWDNKLFKVGASIGVVAIQDRNISVTELLRLADVACYAAKNLGRNRIHVYEPGDAELIKMHGEMQWISRLDEAIDQDQYLLFVQRIAPMDENDHTVHHEVLIRLIETDGIINFPGSFLPAAERYGLMPRLDRWVIHRVLTNPVIQQLQQRGSQSLWSINISWATLADKSVIDEIKTWFKQGVLPPTQVCFEITETAAIANVPATLFFIQEMRSLGCQFSLDDFGSGLSSFGYLRKILPVDYLKIDGNLVRDISGDANNYAMVEAINHIGKVMKIKTVAEFVHDQETYELLKSIQVDYVQGYFIHRPMPIEELLLG